MLPGHGRAPSGAAETTVPAEPEALTAWPLAREVCQLLVSESLASAPAGMSWTHELTFSIARFVRQPHSFIHSFIPLVYSPTDPFIYSVHVFTPFAYSQRSPIRSAYSFNARFQRLCAREWDKKFRVLGGHRHESKVTQTAKEL